MTQKIVLAPAGTVVDNVATFSTTTGQIQDSGVAESALVSGKILQVITTEKTDTFTHSSATWTAVTGLSASITPASASNKILIMASVSGASGTAGAHLRLYRDSTPISLGDAAGVRTQTTNGSVISGAGQGSEPQSVIFLDSPAATSATTYAIYLSTTFTSIYINRSRTDTDNALHGRAASTITVMEVEG